MNTQKLHLSLPHKLALPGASKVDRALIGTAHLALALNATAIFLNVIPFGGITAAILLCSIAYFRRSPFARPAAQQGFIRAILALVLVVIISNAAQDMLIVDSWPLWSVLFLVQTPLSVYDAWRTSKGYMGLRILPVQHKNLLK